MQTSYLFETTVTSLYNQHTSTTMIVVWRSTYGTMASCSWLCLKVEAFIIWKVVSSLWQESTLRKSFCKEKQVCKEWQVCSLSKALESDSHLHLGQTPCAQKETPQLGHSPCIEKASPYLGQNHFLR